MAQIDGLNPAIALKLSDLFMVNQNTSTEGAESRIEKRLPLSDLMAFINSDFDPSTNINSSFFCKKETISGAFAAIAGSSGWTSSGNAYVGISGIEEPVLVRVAVTNANTGVKFHSSGILLRGGFSGNNNDSSTFSFLGHGGLYVRIYRPSTSSSTVPPIPVLDMTSLVVAPGNISYTVDVYHSKSTEVLLGLLDATITTSPRLPAYTVFSTKKTTIEYPDTLPQTPDSDVLYML